MSRSSTELHQDEQIIIGLLNRFRPGVKINPVRASKVYRLGELAVLIGAHKAVLVAHKLHQQAVSLMSNPSYWENRQRANNTCRWMHSLPEKNEAFCCECGARTRLSVDHSFPVFLGGSANGRENLSWMCLPCNIAKGAKFDPMAILAAYLGEDSPWSRSVATLHEHVLGRPLNRVE